MSEDTTKRTLLRAERAIEEARAAYQADRVARDLETAAERRQAFIDAALPALMATVALSCGTNFDLAAKQAMAAACALWNAREAERCKP